MRFLGAYEWILHFLDTKSLSQVNRTSRLLHLIASEQLKWIKRCLTEPECQPLIQAAMLEDDLLNRIIDAKALYKSIEEKNVDKITELLFANETREFALYVPYYENNVPQFFPRAGSSTRKAFFSEEAAKKGTANAPKVKHWPRVKIAVEKSDFEALYRSQELQSDQTILKLPIVTKKEKRKGSEGEIKQVGLGG